MRKLTDIELLVADKSVITLNRWKSYSNQTHLKNYVKPSGEKKFVV